MTLFFYPSSRAHHAYCMARDFGMEFERRFGKWSLDGLRNIDPASNYRIYVHPDSLHLLGPRTGDLLRAEHKANLTRVWEDFTPEFLDYIKEQNYQNIRVIQRKGVAFHWPEGEDA